MKPRRGPEYNKGEARRLSSRTLSAHLTIEKEDLLQKSIGVLQEIKRVGYEQLNQLPHEYACLLLVRRLRLRSGMRALNWRWHPNQTSHPKEGDVIGYRGERAVVQAEVTTSPELKGTLLGGLKKKLVKLSELPGTHKVFGVVSREAEDKLNWWAFDANMDIDVVRLAWPSHASRASDEIAPVDGAE